MTGLDILIPDPWRDEDGPRPEIGSEDWLRAELAAGRSGDELDRPLREDNPNSSGRR